MIAGRVFLIVRLVPLFRGSERWTVIMALALLGALASELSDVVRSVSPYYVASAFIFVTLLLVVHGMPTRAEQRCLKTAAPVKVDRIMYGALSLAWSSCAAPVVGLLSPLFSWAAGQTPPWWMSLMSIGIWALFSAGGAVAVERFEIGKLGTQTTRARSMMPAWYRKEAGLLLTRGGDWFGPVLAVAGALAARFVFPLMPFDIHITAARATGFLLGPLLAEPFVLGITGAEGKRAWLHAVAQEPARVALLRKAVVGAIHVT